MTAKGPDQTMEILTSRVFPVSRDILFDAFADPVKLERWWGPEGFTNTVTRFEFRPGGEWHITMRNSDGTDFENTATFEEVRAPEEIRYFHHGPIHAFTMVMTFFETTDGTRLTWQMIFERNAENIALKKFIAAANEQNFDRLAELLNIEGEIEMNRSDAPDPARTLEVSRLVNAPRDLVFAVLSDPDHIDQWWGPDGFRNETHEMVFAEGGVWRYTMHGPDGKAWPNWIRYRVIDKPGRISYEHGAEIGEPAHFDGQISLEDRGTQTLVTLTLVFPSPEARDATLKFGAVEGGKQTLARLDAYAAQLQART